MKCEHCEYIRAIQRAILIEHGNNRYPGLYYGSDKNPDAMTQAVAGASYVLPNALLATQAACRCECHGPARAVGKLPPLVA